MFDNDAYLVLALCHRTLAVEREQEFCPRKFVATRAAEIEDAGRLLAGLGLAVASSESKLGWRPTTRLMDLVVDCVSRNGRRPEPAGDQLFVDLLRDHVFGDEAEGRGNLGFQLLCELGLLQESAGGGWKVGRQFQDLFKESYYRHHLLKAVAKSAATDT